MKPLNTFRIDTLLVRLRNKPEEILEAIDQDGNLRRCEHDNGLVIANTSAVLFTPEYEHQLYAKGIVYERDPYRLVSLPLLKIYNHKKGSVDALTYALAQEEDISLTFPVKEDGYMGQFFEYEGDTYCTTRSILEGANVDRSSFDFEYVGFLRRCAEDKYPALVDPDVMKGLTVVVEAIHPETQVVTRYEDKEDLVVLAVFDQNEYAYWSDEKVQTWASEHDLRSVDSLASDVTLEQAVSIVETMEEAHVPEGGVLQFEKDGEVIHRVKMKTEEWRTRFSFLYNCTLRGVVEKCFDRPEMEEWSHVRDTLIDEGVPEEVLDPYKKHHETYVQWLELVRQERDEAVELLEEAKSAVDHEGENGQKQLAMYLREHHPKKLTLIMNCYNRSREEFLYDVMWQHELYRGIKGIIGDAKKQLSADDY